MATKRNNQKKPSQARTNEDGPFPPGTLYVIFHGSFAFVPDGDYYAVLATDMGDDHIYRAGSWLAETEVARRGANYPVMLSGVKIGGKEFPGNNAIRVEMDKIDLSRLPVAPYAIFMMPKPAAVIPLFAVSFTQYPKPLTSEDGGGDQPTSAVGGDDAPDKDFYPAMVPVFRYDVREGRYPRLGDYWESPAFEDENAVSTLHIIAENETQKGMPGMTHAVRAFDATARMLGVDLRLQTSHIPACDTQCDVPPGLESRCFEFQPVIKRAESLAELGGNKSAGHVYPATFNTPQTLADPWANIPVYLTADRAAFYADLFCWFFRVGCKVMRADTDPTCSPIAISTDDSSRKRRVR